MPVKISKSNPIFQEFKEILKSNKTKDLVYVDDLSILKLAINYPIKIEKFIYCDELSYKDETLELINQLSNKCNQTYTISKSTAKKSIPLNRQMP